MLRMRESGTAHGAYKLHVMGMVGLFMIDRRVAESRFVSRPHG